MKTLNPSILRPGDVLLYSGSMFNPVDLVIAEKTWKNLTHVECYVGQGNAFAARMEGVNIYPVRVDKFLVCVRRPAGFDLAGAMAAVKDDIGLEYEVPGLFRFFAPWVRSRRTSRICSSEGRKFLRGGGCDPFNPWFPDNAVAPAQLWQTGGLQTVWAKSDSYRLPLVKAGAK